LGPSQKTLRPTLVCQAGDGSACHIGASPHGGSTSDFYVHVLGNVVHRISVQYWQRFYFKQCNSENGIFQCSEF